MSCSRERQLAWNAVMKHCWARLPCLVIERDLLYTPEAPLTAQVPKLLDYTLPLSSCWCPLRPGSFVRLGGLNRRADLNGTSGYVVRPLEGDKFAVLVLQAGRAQCLDGLARLSIAQRNLLPWSTDA
eukprot:gnl/TRDRNA2_/TRDRNA2_34937_c0_seq2.p1 gnl/TRDRNA2_/TRDRNA2_34937_c0~~gnl/TRDRNA2_/TRDRNA2_34937_c0_seq2.p1  ORF type:complete len:127 (-),score=19.28 gnl/TRDRNA2_/TRDRNA2_34937_c0_seq2:63-443(-)